MGPGNRVQAGVKICSPSTPAWPGVLKAPNQTLDLKRGGPKVKNEKPLKHLFRFLGTVKAKGAGPGVPPNGWHYFFKEFYVAGYSYYHGEQIEDSLLEGKIVTFKREPGCLYDTRAVEIYAGKKKLGYIPKKDNTLIASLLDRGIIVKGKIQKRNFDDQPRKRIKISPFRER
jgi:hypothetical protein